MKKNNYFVRPDALYTEFEEVSINIIDGKDNKNTNSIIQFYG